MPRKKKSRQYFTQETEDAIIEYVNSDNQDFRNKIFREKIYQPFLKLTEIMINRGSFSYAMKKVCPNGNRNDQVRTLQQDAIIHLLEKLGKFTPGKGKAYSYFTIVTLNFLIN